MYPLFWICTLQLRPLKNTHQTCFWAEHSEKNFDESPPWGDRLVRQKVCDFCESIVALEFFLPEKIIAPVGKYTEKASLTIWNLLKQCCLRTSRLRQISQSNTENSKKVLRFVIIDIKCQNLKIEGVMFNTFSPGHGKCTWKNIG